MLDLRRAGTNEVKTLYNAPFRLLKSTSYYTPTKSVVFDPTIIDNYGKMHIDWNSSNVFKGLAPIGIGGTILLNNNE